MPKKFTGRRFTADCPVKMEISWKATPSPAKGRSAKTISQGTTIWKWSATRSLTMGTAAFPLIVRNFKKLEEAIRKGRIDCIVVKDLSRFRETISTVAVTLRRFFPSLASVSSRSMMLDSLTGDPQSDLFVIPFQELD